MLLWGLLLTFIGLIAWIKRDALEENAIKMMGGRTEGTEKIARFQSRFFAAALLITGASMLLAALL